MKRSSSKRIAATLLSRTVMPTTMLLGLLAVPSLALSETQIDGQSPEISAPIAVNPVQAAEFIRQARTEIRRNNLVAARSLAERAAIADPENSDLKSLFSSLETAETRAQIAADTALARTLTRSAENNLRAGQLEIALSEITKASSLTPENRDTLRAKARIEAAIAEARVLQSTSETRARIAESRSLLNEGRFAEARIVANEALELDASNRDASRLLNEINIRENLVAAGNSTLREAIVIAQGQAAAPASAGEAPALPAALDAATERERRRRAEAAFREGVRLNDAGDLPRARQRWLDAKDIDPTFTRADIFLQNTQEEFNRLLASQAARENLEAREAAAVNKLGTLITFSTVEPTSLSDFLGNLRLLSGINFVIAGEVRARVEAAFEDEPLFRVLDKTLLPIGLRWDREPGSETVIITPDLRTEVFSVLPDQLVTIDTLITDGVIPRLLYGPTGQPVLQGQEVTTDARRNIVILTDSEQNLRKFRDFVDGLRGTTATQLVFRSYEIDETKAPQLKALLEAVLAVGGTAPFDPERKMVIAGSTLIIRDTPENLARVEELLLDQSFMRRFIQDTLGVRTFNLTPTIEFDDNPDLVRAFAEQVRQVIETLLFARDGRSRAEREGRRLFFDPATLQLTVVDFPDNLDKVQDYIDQLPQIRARRRSKIFFLDWATASDLSSQIESFLGIDGGAGRGISATGNQVTRTLRVDDEIEFNGAFFRVIRVNQNDIADQNDDDVTLIVRTGTSSQETTIQQFRSEFIEDFEIIAEDIRPSNQPGQGRARITIRFVPNRGIGGVGGFDGGLTDPQGQIQQQRQALRSEEGLSIVPIENLNGLFVQFDNIEDLRQVEFWIRTLDIPTLQVSIEVKFVEVATQRAKEWKPRFFFGDLTGGFDFSDSVLSSRFANDADRFGSRLEPSSVPVDANNLLNGTTVFNWIVNSGNSPISFTLSVLESQGVINVVNGPSVTVLNNETADFVVQRVFGFNRPQEGATGGQDQQNLILAPSIRPVDLSITPTVTRAGNITLDIDVEIEDFDQYLGQIVRLGLEDNENPINSLAPYAVGANLDQPIGTLRKELATQARIRDGGTVVLGGWRNERSTDLESGVPILRDIPFIGPKLFNRSQQSENKITLLIFLTGQVVRD